MKAGNIIYIVAFTLITLSGYDLFAQKLDYKDIYPLIEARSFRDALPRLKEFLIIEPDHPSANFQLALIYEERFNSYHPIIQFRPALKNAENAKMRFIKASALVDEKEIKKNGKKYYTNFATVNDKGRLEVEYVDVKQKIDSAYKEFDRFILFVPTIYDYFTKSIQFYSKATGTFNTINGRYKSLKELYLMYDEDLELILNEMKQDYDSTLFYFNAYLEASKNYPVTEYQQSYIIKNIEHYRLDGLLIQNDFLDKEIVFWDYGKWVDEVKSKIVSDIASLRRQIESNEQKLDENLLVLAKPSVAINANIDLKEVDRDLVLKLRNYDNNSIVTPLLLYKNKKQDILFRALKEYEMREDTTTSAKYEIILTYFSQLFDLSLESDSLLKSLSTKITANNLQRHKSFVDTYYRGEMGLQQFMDLEGKFINEKISEYSNAIKYTLIDNSSTFDDPSKLLKYKKMDIPMFINLSDSLEIPGNLQFTSHILVAPDSSLYIGGISRPKSKQNNVRVFLAKTDSLKKIQWYNNYNIELEGQTGVFDNFIGAMELTPEGIAVVITSRDVSTTAITNTFKIIDEKGIEKVTINLERDAVTRAIRYNEQSNSYVLALKGYTFINDLFLTEPVNLLRIDVDGQIIWEQKINLAGNVEDILNVNGGYLVFGNFTSIRDEFGNVKKLNGDLKETNVYAYKLDLKGQIVSQKLFISDKPYYADRFVKINDRNINLLGFLGNYENRKIDYSGNEENVIHIITDSQLNILKSNINVP